MDSRAWHRWSLASPQWLLHPIDTITHQTESLVAIVEEQGRTEVGVNPVRIGGIQRVVVERIWLGTQRGLVVVVAIQLLDACEWDPVLAFGVGALLWRRA
jgi:hypothetical protein